MRSASTPPTDADHNGFADYARRFRSTPGKKDGLYWPAEAGDGGESPLGPLVATAASEGYGKIKTSEHKQPYHGYYYRILTSQGKDAPGGAYDYMVGDKLLGGFAIVAWPATLSRLGRDHLPREPRRRRVPEGLGSADRGDRGIDDALQPGRDVEEGAMKTRSLPRPRSLLACAGPWAAAGRAAGARRALRGRAVREAARADKRGLVDKNMQLTAKEAKKFWPLYDDYQRKLDRIMQRQNRAILDYINAEATMTDANAKRIATEILAADADEQKLRERQLRKLLSVLPARKAVRFIQIENKLRTIQRYDIAERIPLVR